MFSKELIMRKNIKDVVTGKMACQANNFNILHDLFFSIIEKWEGHSNSHMTYQFLL